MRRRSDLRPGQVEAIDHVYERDAGILVLDCGGGKTVTFLTAIRDWVEDGVIDRAIVLAPPKVAATVWPAEPHKWEHLWAGLKVITAEGPAKRKTARKWWASERGTVLSVSLNVAPDLERELRGTDLSRVALVIDEISMLKAPTGTLAKTVEKLAARCAIVWGSTATPRPNDWSDLFRPVRIVTKGAVWGGKGGFDQWRRERYMPMPGGFQWRVHGFAEKEIEADLKPLLYRAKDDPIAGLGEFRQGREFDRFVTLPPEVMAKYRDMEKKLFAKVTADLKGATAEETVFALSAAAGTMKLEQIAQGYLYDEGAAVAELHRLKVEALDTLLQEVGEKENVIITYRFKQDLALLRGLLGDFPVLGDGISGTAAGKAMKAWNAGKVRFLGLHPAAAGHGIELQNGGRRMIDFGLTWSPEQFYQTGKRIHRSGQLRHCYRHRIVAAATVDELKVARVENRIEDQANYLARVVL